MPSLPRGDGAPTARPTFTRPPLPPLSGAPFPLALLPISRVLDNEAFNKGLLAFTRPAFPLPVAPGRSGRPWAFALMLQTPPLPAAQVRVGTDLRALIRSWSLTYISSLQSDQLTRSVRPRVALAGSSPAPAGLPPGRPDGRRPGSPRNPPGPLGRGQTGPHVDKHRVGEARVIEIEPAPAYFQRASNSKASTARGLRGRRGVGGPSPPLRSGAVPTGVRCPQTG